jgi:tetratricopeptide (TPR) repeat protein
MLAVLHALKEVWLVNPTTGRPFARLPGAGSPYGFSPDGSQLVTYDGRDGSFQVWDLRLIRQELAEMGLDWDLPPYPPPPDAGAKPPRVKVLLPEPLPASDVLDAEAHVERGLLQMRLRNYGGAMADFHRAARLDPTRPPWETAVHAFGLAIERDPQDASAYHERAEAHERLGHWEQAIADHSRAFELAPDRLSILVWRGRAYLRTGQEDKAAEDFHRAGALGPEELSRLAWKLATAPDPWPRELSLAVELAERAVRREPAEGTYWNTLGVAHYRLGEWAAAIQALEEAEKVAPGQCLGFNAFFLAMCHHQLGDPVKARDCYDRAVRWCQENHGELSSQQHQELKAFRAEAEALLKAPAPGP